MGGKSKLHVELQEMEQVTFQVSRNVKASSVKLLQMLRKANRGIDQRLHVALKSCYSSDNFTQTVQTAQESVLGHITNKGNS